MHWEYNDGGRKAAGFKGYTGDCVVRAIAIADERSYQEVYDSLFEAAAEYRDSHRDKVAKMLQRRGPSPRLGVPKEIYRPWLEENDWLWRPTMKIGSGTTVHLDAAELPTGRLIVSVSKHMVAVIDGVVQDTHDPSRGGTRAVYGYFRKWED